MIFFRKYDKNKKRFKRPKQDLLFKRKKFCRFTASNIKYVDYKDINTLKCFLQENGKIIPARVSGIKSRYQRQVNKAIKKARFLALLPYIKYCNI